MSPDSVQAGNLLSARTVDAAPVFSRLFSPKTMPTPDEIDALLPQTQCRRCGYPACRPYAEALARGESTPNRCPPGGEALIGRLASLLGVPVTPLDPEVGPPQAPQVARIVEADCIGCTLCLQACPVDAILGAPKRMHTVIEDECTGCGLCLPPCPVDCIVLLPAPAFPEASASRMRFLRRQARLERAEDPRKRIHRPRDEDRLKRTLVAAALARARSGKTHGSST